MKRSLILLLPLTFGLLGVITPVSGNGDGEFIEIDVVINIQNTTLFLSEPLVRSASDRLWKIRIQAGDRPAGPALGLSVPTNTISGFDHANSSWSSLRSTVMTPPLVNRPNRISSESRSLISV